MAQAATTRTITATPATSDSRTNLLRALINETSARWMIDSRAGAQEPPQLLATLILRRGALRRLKGLRPALRGDGRREIGELLRLKRKDLIAGLRRRKAARCRLARRHQRRRLGAVGVEIADDAGLHAQRILQGSDRVLPARLRV